ncbi:hypothetical protein [Acidisphaera sp. S103]|uniref:hypothetical protein n=1 Tax=Acidisphaera sp. S103 TaxID=1747223 RepID=UPI00131B8BE3|nr:hypothetical protein [Acidisphaera sp. S103]
MCSACEGADEQAGISPILAARARRIEARMPGPKVPDQYWDILLGHAGGSVPWPETRRMLTALDQAEQRPGAALRCDAA